MRTRPVAIALPLMRASSFASHARQAPRLLVRPAEEGEPDNCHATLLLELANRWTTSPDLTPQTGILKT
jgi:hypothetical protein